MRQTVAFVSLIAASILGACAHGPDAVMGPDYAAIQTTAAPNARLYADCIAQAATNGTYGRAHDADTELVLFTCTGVPARSFFEGLAAHSAKVGSERQADGRTIRSTNPVQRDLFGVDWCSSDGLDYACVISLNAGAFLTF